MLRKVSQWMNLIDANESLFFPRKKEKIFDLCVFTVNPKPSRYNSKNIEVFELWSSQKQRNHRAYQNTEKGMFSKSDRHYQRKFILNTRLRNTSNQFLFICAAYSAFENQHEYKSFSRTWYLYTSSQLQSAILPLVIRSLRMPKIYYIRIVLNHYHGAITMRCYIRSRRDW